MPDHPFVPGPLGGHVCQHELGGEHAAGIVCGSPRTDHTKPRKPRTKRYGTEAPDLEARRELLIPGSSLIECMVLDCEYALVLPPVDLDEPMDDTLALAAALGISEAVQVLGRERAEWIDATLKRHLQAHDVVEWARTIRSVEDANREWEQAYAETRGNLDRAMEMNEVLSTRLQETEVKLSLAGGSHHPRAPRDLPRDAMPLPMGIPVPVLDPMQERIVPSDKRAEGQVARKG